MVLPVEQHKIRVAGGGEIRYGILSGLMPLFCLAGVTTLAIVLTKLVRHVFNSDGFFVWQRNALITLLTGMALALLVYILALVVVLRRVARWQRGGLTIRSSATLWTLFATACIVLLPVIMAIALPQHPAP